nr:methionine synthase [Corynebacterium lactis]
MSAPRAASFIGLGPMPGTDPGEAAEILIGECMDGRVHLPVLPARGLGTDMVGRTAALMADVNADRGPRSWRIVDRPARLSWLAADYLQRDLDACEEVWGSTPESVRLVATGPWTMAASVENEAGHLVATDRGAVRYFAQSLAAGLLAQASDARRRFSSEIEVEVVLHEPLLSRTARGLLRAPSTLMGNEGFLPAVGYREISAALRETVEPLRADGIRVAIALGPSDGIAPQALAESGAESFWLPRGSLKTTAQKDFAVALIGAGLVLELGIVPVAVTEREEHTGAPVPTAARAIAEASALLWDELGFSRLEIAEKLSLAPAGGFASSAADEAVAQLGAGRKAAELLRRAAGDLGR